MNNLNIKFELFFDWLNEDGDEAKKYLVVFGFMATCIISVGLIS